jgi:hypothetical protein
MKLIQKNSILSELDEMIREQGGTAGVDRILMNPLEYEALMTELGESDLQEYRGLRIDVVPILLKG